MTVAIYLLDRAFPVWVWLCGDCLAKRRAAGWDVKETKTAPHPLRCDDCEAP